MHKDAFVYCTHGSYGESACWVWPGGWLQDTCAVTVRLTDAATGKELPGLLHVADADGRRVPIDHWPVLPKFTGGLSRKCKSEPQGENPLDSREIRVIT